MAQEYFNPKPLKSDNFMTFYSSKNKLIDPSIYSVTNYASIPVASVITTPSFIMRSVSSELSPLSLGTVLGQNDNFQLVACVNISLGG
jgi:hypothetical protein